MEYGIRSAFGKLRHVLMHRPSEELQLVTDPSAWGFKARPNWEKASEEFDAFVETLKSEGVKVTLVESASDVPPPNLYFARDLGLCTRNGLILSYFRHEYRQGEELFLEFMGDRLEIPVFAQIRNGYFEGGDLVLINDRVAAIGIGHRTNRAGFGQLCEFLDEVAIPVLHGKDTHLDAFFSMVDESLAVAYERVLSDDFLTFLAGLDIDLVSLTFNQQKRFAADMLRIDTDKVMIGDDCEETIPLLEERGVDVIPVSVKELKKGNGGPGSLALTLLRS